MATKITDRVLKWVIIIAAIIALTIFVLMVVLPPSKGTELQLKYMQFYFEAFKALIVSFVVAILVVVIPQYLNEAKYMFERLRDSRRAYSEAHTGFTYLEYRLAVLDYGAAILLIEDIHVKKHIAETYDELEIHLRRKNETLRDWSARIANKLDALKHEIGSDYDSWSKSTPQERLQRLRTIVERLDRPPA